MPKFFTDELLRQIRNQIPLPTVFRLLEWPHKRRLEQLAFLCPQCGEYHSAVNPRTNLGRCFQCQTNFNPIDFLIVARSISFVEAVQYLEPVLAHSLAAHRTAVTTPKHRGSHATAKSPLDRG